LVHALPVATVDTEEEVLAIQVHFCRLMPGEHNDTDTSGEYVWTWWPTFPPQDAIEESMKAMDDVGEQIEAYRQSKKA